MFIIQKYISFQLCLFFWSNVTLIIMLMFLTESVRSYYNLILKKAGQFLTDPQVSLLKFALSLRSYSPAIHASQQVCCDLNGMKFTLMRYRCTQLLTRIGCSLLVPLFIIALGQSIRATTQQILIINDCVLFLQYSNVISPVLKMTRLLFCIKSGFLNNHSCVLQNPGHLRLSNVIEVEAGSAPWGVPLFSTQ